MVLIVVEVLYIGCSRMLDKVDGVIGRGDGGDEGMGRWRDGVMGV